MKRVPFDLQSCDERKEELSGSSYTSATLAQEKVADWKTRRENSSLLGESVVTTAVKYKEFWGKLKKKRLGDQTIGGTQPLTSDCCKGVANGNRY